jgi:hypothetical protein
MVEKKKPTSLAAVGSPNSNSNHPTATPARMAAMPTGIRIMLEASFIGWCFKTVTLLCFH